MPLKITHVGNVGSAPELRYLPSGEAVASFSVADNETYKDKDGNKQEITTWVTWTIYGASAENLAKFAGKGRLIYIEGTIRNQKWPDKNTGEMRYRDEHRVSRWKLLDRKPEEAGAEGEGAPGGDDAPPVIG